MNIPDTAFCEDFCKVKKDKQELLEALIKSNHNLIIAYESYGLGNEYKYNYEENKKLIKKHGGK